MDQLLGNIRAFHPKDPARGMLNYDIGALSKHQKSNLNARKTVERGKNEIYLKTHPEIKGLISILLRYVLCSQVSMNIHESIGEFFNRPRYQVVADLLQYFLRTELEEFGDECQALRFK
ncbi:uncharacterized protein LOC122533551 [Frieseomelitta varia]|nr:uncharacterized protein LOC122533551 [Frieseomelitta varia]XP_043519314.1 uncharacterized protein LOC122533551 [Frieseomelitta varia]